MERARIIDVDGDAAVILPQRVLEQWKVAVGDELSLEKVEGGFTLAPKEMPAGA